MIRMNAASDLEAWISDASTSLIASFAGGIIRDRAAIRALPTSVSQQLWADSHEILPGAEVRIVDSVCLERGDGLHKILGAVPQCRQASAIIAAISSIEPPM